MKSPFAIFRKHQKMLMVVLTGLAMFAFIVLDSLQTMERRSSGSFVIVLGALIGGVVFWLIGKSSGKPVPYSAAGAVIGLLLGMWLPSLAADPAPVQTMVGDITHQKMTELINRRQTANNFLSAAYQKVSPYPENPFMAQFWAQNLQNVQFGFGRPLQDDVVLGFLLTQEANEMGIKLSDDAVTKYIEQATGNRLTRDDFRQIRLDMRVSESQLYDAIREELRARLAYILAIPREVVTPEQYWQEYRKLTVRQELDVAAVPVRDFAAALPEPSASDLETFFNQHKANFPDDPNRPPSIPALGQPRRIRTAYLQVEYEAIEKQVAAVTDADIEKFYNENKELYRNRRLNDNLDLGTPGGAEQGSGPIIPDITPERDAGSKTEQPAGATKSDEKLPPAAQQGESKPAEEKKSSDDEPKAENPGEARRDVAAGSLLAQGPGLSRAAEGRLLLAALDDEAAPAKEKAESSADEPKPAAEPNKDASSKDEPKQGAEPASEPAGDNSTDAAAADSKSESQPKSEPKSEPESQVETEPAAPTKRSPVVAARPLPEFRPLDNDLRDEIREQLLRERTLAEQRARIEAGFNFMAQLSDRYHSQVIESASRLTPEEHSAATVEYAKEQQKEFSQQLARYAEEHGLRYVETRPLSARELYESEEEYPIARATEPVQNEFARQDPESVIQHLFGAPPDQFFAPALATDGLNNWFAYWKFEDVAAHVPNLDDPGIREQALAAWRRNEAQPKAEERAKELAELIRKSTGTVSEALAGQTINKKEDGPAVTVIPTPPFSWMRVSSAPSTGLMPNRQPQLSEIPGVENPGSDFMRTVFEEMKVGDVNVVPNADRSIFYVVKVKSRTPSEPSDLEAHRQAFLREELFSGGTIFGGGTTYDYLLTPRQQQARIAWFQQLEIKYGVRRNQPTANDSAGGSPQRPLGS